MVDLNDMKDQQFLRLTLKSKKCLSSRARNGRSIPLILILVLATACSTIPLASPTVDQRGPANSVETLPVAFERARELIQYVKVERENNKGKKQLKLFRPLVESEVIQQIQEKPSRASEPVESLYQELVAIGPNSDPTKHVRLVPPAGQPGYSELSFAVSHRYRLGAKRQGPDNLIQIWRDFLRRAEKEIILNVYEFDLDVVARDLIEAVGRGVKVQVGIDQDVIELKPKLAEIFEKLRSGGVDVVAVNSVGINHQKMAAIDWSDADKARALFSSGNLTQSCLGPEGDLKDLKPLPKESVPNANHVLTMKSWLAANLIRHELTKTFSADLGLRGSNYPTTGAYQITGPNTDPLTLEAYPEGSFIISFTPGGSYRGVNKNMLAHFIESSRGPIRMVQFAYSAQDVSSALLKRAVRDFQETGKFDFLSIGDTPFAMQGWSQFLKMSGLRREVEIRSSIGPKGGKIETKISRFLEDDENPWKKELSPRQLRQVRKAVRIAPRLYGNSVIQVAGSRHAVSAKIHHKLMSAGEFAVVGTSFNFSEGAENNNEQVLVFRDKKMVSLVHSITAALASESRASVYEEALRRNARNLGKGSSEDDTIDIVNAKTVTPD